MPSIIPFRPTFTRRLGERLAEGQVINLIGTDAQGASRLAMDLGQMLTGARYLDWDRSRRDEIFEHLGLEQAQDWHEATAELDRQSGPAYLIFDHFDRALQQPQWDDDFWQPLAQVWYTPSLGMLLVTEQPLSEQAGPAGWPEAVEMVLPPLGFKRLKEEIKRHFPDYGPWHELATPIFSHPEPYPFLEHVLVQMKGNPMLVNMPVEEWMPAQIKAYNQLRDLSVEPEEPAAPSPWQRLKRWMKRESS